MSTVMLPTDIRNHVRGHLDVDATDLPDSVLNTYMNEGYDKLLGYFGDSPVFLQVAYSFSSAAAQQTYSYDGPELTTTPSALQTIIDVRGDTWSLKPADHRQIREAYRTTSPPTSKPTEYSVSNRTLWLWPIPNGTYNFTVTGVRQAIDWVTTNQAPDCPAAFHNLIAVWALGRGYLQQDDLYSAGFLRDEFQFEAANRARRWTKSNAAQPLVVGGARKSEQWRVQQQLGPLIYDWE